MKEIRVISHIIVDGQEHLASDIPEERRNEIFDTLTRRFMRTLGAVPDKEVKKA